MENTNTIQVQWAEICAQLAQTVSDTSAMRWLNKIVPGKIENNQVDLTVASPCVRELIEQKYLEKITSLWKLKNTDISTVNLKLAAAPKQKMVLTTLPATESPTSNLIVNQEYTLAEPQKNKMDIPCYLDKAHTFDSFVVGKSNQFAYAAAKKVAEEDAVSFNSFYIHAGSGLGKTHLLHAIAWRLKERHPEKNVLYLSCEQFFQRAKSDLNTKDKDAFLTFVQSVDVLLIDDIQFLLSKGWTQEIFLETFNHLVAQHKMVILSADSMPSALNGLNEKLRGRISQGLVVDIAPADENLRLGILLGKNKEIGAVVPDDVLAFLAKNITSNVRELEGALNRIKLHSECMGNVINLETTREVLKDVLHTFERPVKAPEIQRVVAAYYKISLEDLQSKRRDRSVVRPRQIAVYLTKVLTPLPLTDIALCFKRDHSTIKHAVSAIENLLQRDKKLAAQVAELTSQLKAGNYA